MQGRPKYFNLSGKTYDVVVVEANNNLRVIVI